MTALIFITTAVVVSSENTFVKNEFDFSSDHNGGFFSQTATRTPGYKVRAVREICDVCVCVCVNVNVVSSISFYLHPGPPQVAALLIDYIDRPSPVSSRTSRNHTFSSCCGMITAGLALDTTGNRTRRLGFRRYGHRHSTHLWKLG